MALRRLVLVGPLLLASGGPPAGAQGPAWAVDGQGSCGDCRLVQDCPPLQPLLDRLNNRGPGNVARGEAIAQLRTLAGKCPPLARKLQVCCQTEPNASEPEPDPEPEPEPLGLPSESECGLASFQGNIIAGKNVGIGEHPWVVSIQYSDASQPQLGLQHGCGGTLITKRHVLTAAHCVRFLANPDITPVEVRLGEVDFDSSRDCLADFPDVCAEPPQNVNISAIIHHPGFQNIPALGLPNDIAVLALSEEVTFSEFRRPICLPVNLTRLPSGSDLTPGHEATIVGWGGVDIDRLDPFFSVLQSALVPVQPREQCRQAFNLTFPLERRICAGGAADGADACSGDSGGPLMVPSRSRFFQTGITSFGDPTCGRLGAYTRVHDYMDWILETIASN